MFTPLSQDMMSNTQTLTLASAQMYLIHLNLSYSSGEGYMSLYVDSTMVVWTQTQAERVGAAQEWYTVCVLTSVIKLTSHKFILISLR